MKNFMLGVLATAVVLLVMGNTKEQSKAEARTGRYQLAASSIYSDVFVLDTATGQLYRFAYLNPRSTATSGEEIIVETYGTPTSPEYKEIRKLSGKEWPPGLVY